MRIIISNSEKLTVNNCRELIDRVMQGDVIFLHTQKIDRGMTQRIIDFFSGSCFATGCKLEKVTEYDFLVIPKSVEYHKDLK